MIDISLKAEEIANFGGFPLTNSFLASIIVLILFIILGFLISKNVRLIPCRMQNFLELILEKILGIMDSILGDRWKSERYFPLIATIFLAVLAVNWFGLLPGVGSIGLHELDETGTEHFVPILRAASADLNFTVALALCAVVFVQIAGMSALGVRRYGGKFFTLKNPIYTFIGFLELLSEMTRVLSFSVRLFGNIFAGEVLLIVMAFLAPWIVPVPFLFLEIFVGFIQAFVFSILTLVFIAMAITGEAEQHH